MIFSGIGLYFYNSSLDTASEKLQDSIVKKQGEISEISKDKRVVVSRILSSNTLPATLNLRGIIASFRDLSARTNVRLKGFSISRDEITTTLIATEGNPNLHPDPASTIVTMMRAYMTSTGDGRFTLDPIMTISGDPKMRTTGIKLRLVPNTIK